MSVFRDLISRTLTVPTTQREDRDTEKDTHRENDFRS